MSFLKKTKDELIKLLLGKSAIPRGLFELQYYFRHYEPITFTHKKSEDGTIIAISENFRYGSIITSGKTIEELDRNIKDAILTSFEIPSSFADEAAINRVGNNKEVYAAA